MKIFVRNVLHRIREGIKPAAARHVEQLTREIRAGTARVLVAHHAVSARDLVALEASHARDLVAEEASRARDLVAEEAQTAVSLLAKDKKKDDTEDPSGAFRPLPY